MTTLHKTFIATFSCREYLDKESSRIEHAGFEVTLLHRPADPPRMNRLLLSQKDWSVELLPGKGLTLSEAFYQNRPIFWDPPAPLFDPDTLALTSDEILIEGVSAPGAAYLKTYTGGIEFLGLSNWGMHVTDPATGKIQALHGEVGLIPAETVSVRLTSDSLELTGVLPVRTFQGDSDLPWYERGELLYEVTRTLRLEKGAPTLWLFDTMTNVATEALTPDWGYHVTLRPEQGAQLLIPSRSVQNRNGEPVPQDHEVWKPAERNEQRVEHGIIHKGLRASSGLIEGRDMARIVLQYPDGPGIAVAVPPAPYFQTWFCAGGAGSTEFTYADGTPVLHKNWDGQGIEFGSSALDHDGNIDPAVSYTPSLAPGASYTIPLRLDVLPPEATHSLVEEIRVYNQQHRKERIST